MPKKERYSKEKQEKITAAAKGCRSITDIFGRRSNDTNITANANEGGCSSWSEEPLSPANQSGTSSEADLSTDNEIDVLNENTNDLQLRFANSEEIKRDHRLFDERRYKKEYVWLYYNFSKNGYLCKVCEKPGGSRGAWSHRPVHFKDNPGKKLTHHDKSDSHSFAHKSLTNIKIKDTLEKPDESSKEKSKADETLH